MKKEEKSEGELKSKKSRGYFSLNTISMFFIKNPLVM